MDKLTREQMLEIIKTIDPFYIEMLIRIHPVFNRCLSIKNAGEELGICEKTAKKIWNKFLEEYPMVRETMRTHTNPLNISRTKVRNPKLVGDIYSDEYSDGTINGDEIVEKF